MNKLPEFPSFSNVKKLSVQTSPNKLLPVIFFNSSPSPSPSPSPSYSNLEEEFDHFMKEIEQS